MLGIISLVFGVIELALVLRFFFLLFGASPVSPFVSWIYSTTAPLVAPFAGIFNQPGTVLVPGNTVQSAFDIPTLIALVIMAAIGGIILALLGNRSH